MSRNITLSFALLAAIVCTASLAGASDVRPIVGPVILAKASPTATYIWDATAYLAQLSSDHVWGDGGLRATEATATAALAARASDVDSKDMSISVIYKRSGLGPSYGSATFADQQKLFELHVDRAFVEKGGPGLARSVAEGKQPQQIKITVIGALPDAQ
jgi:hypothetical protein